MAAGFCQLNRKSDWQIVLRYQAQAERLYRRAIEDFERIRAFRGTTWRSPATAAERCPAPAVGHRNLRPAWDVGA